MFSFGVSIVGCGLVGTKRFLSMPSSCELISHYDVQQDAAERLSTLAPQSKRVKSIEEILSDDQVTIVVVATDHASLADVALSAINAGKHVLVEKPGGRTPKELGLLVQAATRSGVKVQVGFNHRFHPAITKVKQIVESKKYGNLLWLRGHYGHGGRKGYETEWRALRHLSGGGELLDQGSHLIDLAQYLFGPSALQFAHLTTDFWDIDVEDNAIVVLKPASGGTVLLHASWTDWKNTFALDISLCTAKIEVRGLGGSYGTETMTLYEMSENMGVPSKYSLSWDTADNSWGLEFLDFIQRINGGDSIGASVQSALATLEIIETAYTS